jgi:hypothetical protein
MSEADEWSMIDAMPELTGCEGYMLHGHVSRRKDSLPPLLSRNCCAKYDRLIDMMNATKGHRLDWYSGREVDVETCAQHLTERKAC